MQRAGPKRKGTIRNLLGALQCLANHVLLHGGLLLRAYKVYVIESLGEKVDRVWALWAGRGGPKDHVAVRHFAIIHGKDFLSCLSFVISNIQVLLELAASCHVLAMLSIPGCRVSLCGWLSTTRRKVGPRNSGAR